MAIDAQCPHCRKLLRAPDKKAGQQVNCPHCQQPIIVPSKVAANSALQTAGAQPLLQPIEASAAGFAQTATESSTGSSVQIVATTEHGTSPLDLTKSNGAPAAGAPHVSTLPSRTPLTRGTDLSWYMRTPDDQQYGPVQRDELDRWVGEGRVDADCQILYEGWKQWKWASEIYAQLVGPNGRPPEIPGIDATATTSPFPRFEGTQATSLVETGSNSPATSNTPPPLPSSTATASAAARTGFLSAPAAESTPEGRAWIVTDAGLAVANVALWIVFGGTVALFALYSLRQTIHTSATLSIVSALFVWTTYALLAAQVVLMTSWCVCLSTPRQSAARGWIQGAVAASFVGLAIAIFVSILGLALNSEFARGMVRHLPTMLSDSRFGRPCEFRSVLVEIGELFWRRAVKSTRDVLRRVPGRGPGVDDRRPKRDRNEC